jgi:ATP-dependent Clp protease ATP-binding subunit ClpA
VEIVVIDMATCHNVFDLFGSNAGYQRSEDGSKLNNFLAKNSGKRSVVFFDEFDKTNQGIRNALLLLTQSGKLLACHARNFTDDFQESIKIDN